MSIHRPTLDWTWLGLAALLVIAAVLRFSYADWDGGNQLHPDERAILFVASEINAPSSLNPFRAPDGTARQYPYGHLPLYLTVALGNLFGLPCSEVDACDWIAPNSFLGRLLNVNHTPPYVHFTYMGRALSAFFDTMTVAAVYLLSRRLFNPQAALISSAMLTFAVIHIQNSHFGTVDTVLTFFATSTLFCLVSYTQTDRQGYSILAGVFAGFALGTKASAVYLLIPFLVAHVRIVPRHNSKIPSLTLRRFGSFWLSVPAAGLAFALTNPYAILDFIPFVTSLVTQAQVTSGAADFPFTRQYSGTLPLLYPIEQQMRWFLGIPLTVAVYTGLVWGTVQLRLRSRATTTIVIWVWMILLTAGMQFMKFPRYLLPALPAMFVLAGGALASAKLQMWQRCALVAAILIPSALYAVAFVQMYQTPHPWIAASEWVYTELPAGTRIISEKWDDPLPLDLAINDQGYLREAHTQSVLIDPFSEPDDLAKLDAMATEIASADYIILSSNRLYGVIPRLNERYPITSGYYRALFAEELGFSLERTFSRYPILFGIALEDNPLAWPDLPDPGIEWPKSSLHLGRVDESFTIYDHPLVLVFRNVRRFSADEIEARILANSHNSR